MTLDDLRDARPELGFAVYAYTPGGAVTLEVHSNGEVFSFTASTEAKAIEMAFPSSSEEPPGEKRASPAAASTVPASAEAAGGSSEESVFD